MKLALAKLITNFASVVIDNKEYSWEGVLTYGVEVYVLEKEDLVPLESGELVYEDKTYTIEAGKVTKIDGIPEQVEKPTEEKPTEEETFEENNIEDDVKVESSDIEKRLIALEDAIKTIVTKLEEYDNTLLVLKETVQSLTTLTEKLSKSPVAKPATTDIDDITKTKITKGAGKYFEALNK